MYAYIEGCLYSVEWNHGMEWWNGTMEWNGGIVERPRPPGWLRTRSLPCNSLLTLTVIVLCVCILMYIKIIIIYIT